MRQILLTEPGSFIEQNVAPPTPAPGEALVRVNRVGVCGSDFHAFAGRHPAYSFPRVIGHEISGTVVSAPSNELGIQAGDRCAVEPYLTCGACRACRLNRPNCCESLKLMGAHVDGGMRAFLPVPLEKLHKSVKLSLDQLALIETLGIGAHAVTRAALQPGEQTLVVGAGPIGLAVMQFARAAGAQVHVLEVSASRRAFVEKLGFEAFEAPTGRLYDAVLDATGNARAMEASFDHVAHAARIVFVGLVSTRISLDDPMFHRREITLLASRNSCHQFPRIIRMIEDGHIDTTPWITDRMSLAQVPAEFPGLPGRPNLVKAIVEIGEGDA